MEEQGRHVNPYHGIWFGYLAMVLFPTAVFILLYYIVDRYYDHPLMVNIHIALGFAGAVGALTTIICWFWGVGPSLFGALADRVRETKELFGGLHDKDGRKWYWTRFVEDGGFILWSFLPITLIFAAISAYGFISFANWYAALQ